MANLVWSEAALALFDLTGDTAVSAGAGSGKTTALVELCLRLLSGEATGAPLEPGAIAAITFTEKAAAELGERLRRAVADRAAAAVGEVEAAAWRERLRALDRLQAGMIHAFCGRLLRDQALEAGLDPGFRVLEEAEAEALRASAARAAVVAALDGADPAALELSAGHTAEARRGGLAGLVVELMRARATRGDTGALAVAAGDGPKAEAARDGLLAAADRLLASRGEARTAGARGLVERVERALGGLGADDRSGPVDGAALGRFRALEAAAGGRVSGKGEEGLRALKDEVKARLEVLELAAVEALGGPQREALARMVADAEARFLAAKDAAAALDFDDLLSGARDLLTRQAPLRAELRGRLGALLVDEYQDVNGLQQALVDLLSGPGLPGDPPGPVLVAVGDLKQSIYRFRGADVGVFAGLLERLEAGRGRVLHLGDNHRSNGAILALVNAVSEVTFRPPAGEAPRPDELTFRPEDRLLARRAGGPARAAELLVDGEGGDAAARREREARAIAARIAALVAGHDGALVAERGEGGVERLRAPRHGDVAILFRRLTALGPYERALRAAGIPFQVARGGGFYRAPEVRDLGELLASLADPGDEVAWAALLRSPLCAISDGALVALAQRRATPDGRPGLAWLGRPEAEALLPTALAAPLPGDEARRLARFLSVRRALEALRDRRSPAELLEQAVGALDLEAALLAAPDGERRWRNVEKALALAQGFGERGGTVAGLAARWRDLAGRPPKEPEAELPAADAVSIMTIHQAKGLEWPVVLVPDLGAARRPDADPALLDGDGRLCAAWYDPAAEVLRPTASLEAARQAARRSAAAESRRLLYVAMTRAKDLLVLSGEGAQRGETWRGWVEAAGEALLRRTPSEAVAGAAADAAEEAPASRRPEAPAIAVGGVAGEREAAAPDLAAPRLAAATPPAPIRLAVTDLVEYARCPRRHHLGRRLGLPEPKGQRSVVEEDDPARATARGTLAHAMISEIDLGAPPLERRAQVLAAATRRGFDAGSVGVSRIAREVLRFLASAEGTRLARAAAEGRLRREVPFLLRLDGADGAVACYLQGALDALIEPARAGAPHEIVDFKYAVARPESAAAYRLQLTAYAAAVARARPGEAVTARLQFLRGDQRTVDLTPDPAALAAFEAEAPALAREAARGQGDRPPAALGRTEAGCRADGCGYVARCWAAPGRAAHAGPPPPGSAPDRPPGDH